MALNWRTSRPATVGDLQRIQQAIQALQRSIDNLTTEIQKMSGTQNQLDAAIANLQAQVTAESSQTQAAVTLLNGIPGMINSAVQEALAAGATPQQLQAITDAANALAANAQSLGQAVTANTPSAGGGGASTVAGGAADQSTATTQTAQPSSV